MRNVQKDIEIRTMKEIIIHFKEGFNLLKILAYDRLRLDDLNSERFYKKFYDQLSGKSEKRILIELDDLLNEIFMRDNSVFDLLKYYQQNEIIFPENGSRKVVGVTMPLNWVTDNEYLNPEIVNEFYEDDRKLKTEDVLLLGFQILEVGEYQQRRVYFKEDLYLFVRNSDVVISKSRTPGLRDFLFQGQVNDKEELENILLLIKKREEQLKRIHDSNMNSFIRMINSGFKE